MKKALLNKSKFVFILFFFNTVISDSFYAEVRAEDLRSFNKAYTQKNDFQKPLEKLLPIDVTCDQEFTNAYYAKKDCLFNGDNEQCKNLAILNKIGVAAAGTGIGALAGKVFDSYMDRNLKFKENILKVVQEIKQSRKLYNEIEKLHRAIGDQVAKELTKGEFKTLNELNTRVAIQWNNGQNYAEVNKQSNELTKKKFAELIESEKDPEKKQAMKAFESYSSDKYAENRIAAKVAEVFPEEMKNLKSYYDLKEMREKIYNDKSLLEEARAKSWKEYTAQMETAVSKLPEKSQLMLSLAENGIDNIARTSKRRPNIKTALKIINNENLLKGINTTKRIAKGAVEGLAIGLALDQAHSYMKHKYMTYYFDKCSRNLGLSNDETNYLNEYNLIADQNIVYQGSEIINFDSHCEKFLFNMSEDALSDSFEKYGGVPSGICKMLKKESASIDHLLEGDISKIDCNKNSYLKPSTIMGIFKIEEFESNGVVSLYDSDANWPVSFGLTKNQSGKLLPCMTGPNNNSQENIKCSQLQIKSCYGRMDATCSWVSDAAKMRVGKNIVSSMCPEGSEILKTEESGSRANSISR